jgi:hypothetical protein
LSTANLAYSGIPVHTGIQSLTSEMEGTWMPAGVHPEEDRRAGMTKRVGTSYDQHFWRNRIMSAARRLEGKRIS